MYLQKLVNLADRIPKTPPGYQMVPVAWSVDLDMKGNVAAVTELGEKNGKKKARRIMMAPHIGRSGDISPKLVVDNGTYVLGLPSKKHNREKAELRHKAYRGLIEKACEATGSPALKAIRAFLDREKLPELPENFDPETNVTFRVDGQDPTDDPKAIEFWGDYTGDRFSGGENETTMGQCLICGERKPILKRLEYKIKGVPGGQPSGTQIICCDKAAFESYGLENSLNAPTCRECGEKFTKAINWLLSNPLTCRRIRRYDGGKVADRGAFLFWTDRGVTDTLTDFLGMPGEEEAAAYVDEKLEGRTPEGDENFPVYAMYIVGNGGRAAVKMWEETSRSELRERVNEWLSRQEIVGYKGIPEPPKPLLGYFEGKQWRRGLLDSLAPLSRGPGGGKRDIPRIDQKLVEDCASAVLHGWRLPAGLLQMALRRCELERNVDPSQAAIIKMMISKTKEEETAMTGLNRDNTDPAYVCGRIMATLERIQEASARGSAVAKQDRGASMIEKQFGMAMRSPRAVFPMLIEMTRRAYLNKVRRQNYGAYRAMEKEMFDLHDAIGAAYPHMLSMEGRGAFLLGYYHQRAANWAEWQERKAAKAAAEEAAA